MGSSYWRGSIAGGRRKRHIWWRVRVSSSIVEGEGSCRRRRDWPKLRIWWSKSEGSVRWRGSVAGRGAAGGTPSAASGGGKLERAAVVVVAARCTDERESQEKNGWWEMRDGLPETLSHYILNTCNGPAVDVHMSPFVIHDVF